MTTRHTIDPTDLLRGSFVVVTHGDGSESGGNIEEIRQSNGVYEYGVRIGYPDTGVRTWRRADQLTTITTADALAEANARIDALTADLSANATEAARQCVAELAKAMADLDAANALATAEVVNAAHAVSERDGARAMIERERELAARAYADRDAATGAIILAEEQLESLANGCCDRCARDVEAALLALRGQR